MSRPMLNYSIEADSDIFSLMSNSTDNQNLTCFTSSCVLGGFDETMSDEETPGVIGNLDTAQQIIYDVFVPISLVLGIPGNIAILMTVLTMPMSPAVIYIILMTVGDLTALIIKGVIEIIIRYTVNISFELVPWLVNLYYSSGLYPNWILVMIGFERLCAVRMPFLKNRIFTTWSVKLSGAFLFLAVACIYVTVTIVTNPGSNPWVITVFCSYTLLPLICILITTVLTIRTLVHSRQKRLKMSRSDRTTDRQANRAEQSLTVMMVAAAICFLCLAMPLSILLFLQQWGLRTNRLTLAVFVMVLTLSLCLFNLTHSINCYLYFLVSANFRISFLNLVLCRNKKRES